MMKRLGAALLLTLACYSQAHATSASLYVRLHGLYSPQFAAFAKQVKANGCTSMTTARASLIAKVFKLRIADGTLAKKSALYYVGADECTSDINWVAPGSNNLADTGSILFKPDYGWGSDQTASYMTNGATVATMGQCVQNSCHLGGYVQAMPGSGTGVIFGTSNASTGHINLRETNTFVSTVIQSAGSFASQVPPSLLGYASADRSSSTTVNLYQGGASLGAGVSQTSAATTADTLQFMLSTASTFGDAILGEFDYGAADTSADEANEAADNAYYFSRLNVVAANPNLYVSNVAANGIAVGSDTVADGTAAHPYATPAVALPKALAGQTVTLNGTTGSPATYTTNAVLVMNTPGVNLGAVQPLGAIIQGTNSAATSILDFNPTTTTAGCPVPTSVSGLIFEGSQGGGNYAAYPIETVNGAGPCTLNMTGNIIRNYATYGLYAIYSTAPNNISLNLNSNSWSSGLGVSSSINAPSFCGQITSASETFAVVHAMVSTGAYGNITGGCPGARVTVSNVTSSMTSVQSEAAAGYHYGWNITNIKGFSWTGHDSMDGSLSPRYGVEEIVVQTQPGGPFMDSGSFNIGGLDGSGNPSTLYMESVLGGAQVKIGSETISTIIPAGYTQNGTVHDIVTTCGPQSTAVGEESFLDAAGSNSLMIRLKVIGCGDAFLSKSSTDTWIDDQSIGAYYFPFVIRGSIGAVMKHVSMTAPAAGLVAVWAPNTYPASNTGTTYLGPITAAAPLAQGVYTMTMTSSTAFTITGPGGYSGTGTLGSAYSTGGMSFSPTQGSIPSAAGDFFPITVHAIPNEACLTYTTNTDVPGGVAYSQNLVMVGNICSGFPQQLLTNDPNNTLGMLSGNDWYPGTGGFSSNAWFYRGVNYGSLAAWQSAVEPTAMSSNPTFVSSSNLMLQSSSPIIGTIPYDPIVPFDYANHPFKSPASPGAYEIYP